MSGRAFIFNTISCKLHEPLKSVYRWQYLQSVRETSGYDPGAHFTQYALGIWNQGKIPDIDWVTVMKPTFNTTAGNFLHGKVGDFFLIMLDGQEHHCYLSIIFWSTTIISNSRTVTSSMLILVSCMISIYQIVDCGCKNNLMIHTHHLTIIIAPIPMISSHLTGKTYQPAPTPLFIPD